MNINEALKNFEDEFGNKIPEYMHQGFIYYIESGILPGDFLSAILCNNLKEAVYNADSTNIHLISTYIKFLYKHFPYNIWGSKERVQQHLEFCLNRTNNGGAAGEAPDQAMATPMPEFKRRPW
jgi:hypothetical protein